MVPLHQTVEHWNLGMLAGEEKIDLTQAAKRCPGRPSCSALWRWCRRGIRARSGERVCLEHVRVGGRLYTSHAACERFFVSVTAADAEHFRVDTAAPLAAGSLVRSQRQRDAEINRAQEELKRDRI